MNILLYGALILCLIGVAVVVLSIVGIVILYKSI